MGRKSGWCLRLKNGVIRFVFHGRAVLIILGLSLLANFNYTEADDWTRTLGCNYDLFGSNMKIHTLYLGSDALSDPENIRREESLDESVKQSCDLRSMGQSMKESYYLLNRANRRYRLSRVYLCREGNGNLDSGAGKETGAREGEWIEEDMYLQKIITYCEEKNIMLIIAESRDQLSAFFSKC